MSRWFWPAAAVGWAIILATVAWAVAHPGAAHPLTVGAVVIMLLLIHDLVIAPLVCAVGVGMRKRAKPDRGLVQVAMVLTAIVALFSVPLIAGWGKLADNPSLLPGNYLLGLAIILAATWLLTGVLLLRARRRRRDRAEPRP